MDRRFAIVIGINDYEQGPLEYCAKDAMAVAAALSQRCGFRDDDIYTIISDEHTPIKDISGRFEDACKRIEDDLIPNEGSVFFYFAGHGEYEGEKSMVLFQDSTISITSIFDRLNSLNPKYQCYVVDACESGGKVLSRGTTKSLLNNYLSTSFGITLMYAATITESAKEYPNLGHGLFTYYFLSILNNEALYDEDGILTPNKIQDYITRETARESKFKQTPVVENRITGYYPFAFKLDSLPSESSTDANTAQEGADRSTAQPLTAIVKQYFPEIPSEIRQISLAEVSAALPDLLAQARPQNKSEYEIIIGDDLSIFTNKIADAITESIAPKSRSENVEAVSSLFSTERVEKKLNLVTASLIDVMLQKSEPQYSYYNNIRWADERLVAHTAFFKAKSIYQASCGFVLVVYQSIYGIGLAFCSFHLDYTGYGETQLNGPDTTISAFKIHPGTTEAVSEVTKKALANFNNNMDKWNQARSRSINAYDSKSK